MMLDLLAFKATDVPAKNEIINGDFSMGYEGWSKHTEINSFYFEIVDGVAKTTSKSSTTSIVSSVIPQVDYGDVFYTSVVLKVHSIENMHYLQIIQGNAGVDGSTRITPSEEFEKYSFNQERLNPDAGAIRILLQSRDNTNHIYVKRAFMINLTKVFGKGSEPSSEQMDALLERFPNSWFDGTKNLFNAKDFMNTYHKKITELENAITSLGGGS